MKIVAGRIKNYMKTRLFFPLSPPFFWNARQSLIHDISGGGQAHSTKRLIILHFLFPLENS